MKVKMWGVRGSVASFRKENMEFGGNTACISVETDEGKIVIFDAGSGLVPLGKMLMTSQRENKHVSIVLSHAHWDHVHGLNGFEPLYSNDWQVDIYAPKLIGGVGIKQIILNLFNKSHFPVSVDNLTKKIKLREFENNSTFKIADLLITSVETNHPGSCVGFKVKDKSWTLFYSGDHEHTPQYSYLESFIKDVDVIIADGTYTAEDYELRKGWGHTPMELWPQIVAESNVKQLILTHFDVDYDDPFLYMKAEELHAKFKSYPFTITLAKEGLEIFSPVRLVISKMGSTAEWVADFSRRLSKYYNVATILDTILLEARNICNADAGTIYLTEGDRLSFEYSQNDTLFNESGDNKHLYINAKMPINNSSIAGFVANNAEIVNIADVYELDSSLPYSFNKSFDKSSNYRTQSMLTVPFIGSNSKVIGVMQLINATSGDLVIQFTDDMVEKIRMLCIIAADAVRRGQMSIETVMRMLQMSSLKDPKETGSHVKRVGTVAAELYLRWAKKNNVNIDIMKSFQDNIRIAAMLHDVGKIGIPDAIIKKPGGLTPEERLFMQKHCMMGAELFRGSNSGIDIMSQDVALNHHQKWDGTGYTGSEDAPLLEGAEIPLSARITAIADVYDALVSKRSYKDAWDDSDAVDILKKDSGSHFDPELVVCFTEIMPTVKAIYMKYSDEINTTE